MTDVPKHLESLSRREMIATTAAALVTPLLQAGAVTTQPAVGVPGKFLTAAGEQDAKTAPERFFRELKGWTARGYYTSKIGIHLDQEYKGNVYQRGEFAGYDAK